MLAPVQRGAERGVRASKLEAARSAVEHLDRLAQVLEAVVALDGAEDAERAPEPRRRARIPSEGELLVCDGARLVAAPQLVQRERLVRAPARHRRGAPRRGAAPQPLRRLARLLL